MRKWGKLENNKSPGIDGLSAEFYKFFWGRLKVTLHAALKYAVEIGILHRSARRGLIQLIPKKNRDLLRLNNWRPITLLNLDYKILSKALALRMKGKLPFLIDEDQSGFMQDRNISHNIRKIVDIIQIAERRKLAAILISIDFERCFDQIAFSAIERALAFFNFGPFFRQCVMTLFESSMSCVINNGYTSDYFYLEKSTKQGCCISPYLAICVLELFAIQVRANSNIKGVVVGETEYKLIQFADDLNLPLLFEQATLEELSRELDVFEGTTGLKVNYDKTSIYRFGSLKNSNARLYSTKPFHWTNDPVNILGIEISNNELQSQRNNLYAIFDKAEQVCKLWSKRRLSLIGKIVIINSLISSLFVYKLSVLFLLTDSQIKAFEEGLRKFLWDGKRAKIKLSTLYNLKEFGGLGLIDIRCEDIALKAQWVSTYKNFPKVRNLANQFLPKIGSQWWNCNLLKKDICLLVPECFWQYVSIAWFSVKFCRPKTVPEILNQSLWHNSLIKINKKTVWIQSAFDQGISTVENLLKDGINFYSYNEFKTRFHNCMNFVQYYGLLKAIPREWLKILNDGIFAIPSPDVYYNSPNWDYNLLGSKISKMVYTSKCVDVNMLREIHAKWCIKIAKLNDSMISFADFVLVFETFFQITPCPKHRSFFFRLLHRRIFLNEVLYKWKIVSSSLCSYCETDYETIEHLFVQCPITRTFWQKFQGWFECMTDAEILLSPTKILFNNFDNEVPYALFLNTALLTAKHFIFVRKCLDKSINFYIFKDHLREIMKMERDWALKTKRTRKFRKKWALWLK